ncbi:Chromo domain [Cordyceps javanica]|nr:Chromo domain [Cordyceps javanica]
MNALLATIFSPLKEKGKSRNTQALDRLEGITTPTRKRGPPGRATPKSVSFDMAPRAQVKHTPPRTGHTPVAPERREFSSPRKRKPLNQVLGDGNDEAGQNEGDATVEIAESPVPVSEPSEPTAPTKTATATSATGTTDTADDVFTFKAFLDHRWKDDSIEIQVEWENGQRTWEPETNLHDDAPQTLLDYWRQQPDGRPDNPRQPGLYEIHAIRKHSRDRRRLFVEWVGFSPTENTWEPRDVVADAAPDILSDYFDSLPRPKRRRVR